MKTQILVHGVQYQPWNVDGKNGVSSFLFIDAIGDVKKGFAGRVPKEVRATDELAQRLFNLTPTPFPCVCEVEFDMSSTRKGVEMLYTHCDPVAKVK